MTEIPEEPVVSEEEASAIKSASPETEPEDSDVLDGSDSTEPEESE